MGSDDVDIGVEVDELKGDEYADECEVVLCAEPAQMEDFMEDYATLDEYEGDESLLFLRPCSESTLHLIEPPVAA